MLPAPPGGERARRCGAGGTGWRPSPSCGASWRSLAPGGRGGRCRSRRGVPGCREWAPASAAARGDMRDDGRVCAHVPGGPGCGSQRRPRPGRQRASRERRVELALAPAS